MPLMDYIILLRAGFYCIVIIYRQSRKTQDGGVCGAADGGDDPRGKAWPCLFR